MARTETPKKPTVFDRVRLSDRIFEALDLAIDQQDVAIAELLARCLEISMTRNAGGAEFVERREYPDDFDRALTRLDALKRSQGFVMR